MDRDEIRRCLERKQAILDAIRANTEGQGRLLPKGRLTGIGRLLAEREALIGELAALEGRLQGAPECAKLFPERVRSVAQVQQELLALCGEVLRQVGAERARMAAELARSRVMRQAKSHYVHTWQVKSFIGNRLNVKG